MILRRAPACSEILASSWKTLHFLLGKKPRIGIGIRRLATPSASKLYLTASQLGSSVLSGIVGFYILSVAPVAARPQSAVHTRTA